MNSDDVLSNPNTGAIRYPRDKKGDLFPIMTLAVKINPFLYKDFDAGAAYEMCARNGAANNMFITPDDGRTWYVVLYIKKSWPSKYTLSINPSSFNPTCKLNSN